MELQKNEFLEVSLSLYSLLRDILTFQTASVGAIWPLPDLIKMRFVHVQI
jgi:hypothetical protein